MSGNSFVRRLVRDRSRTAGLAIVIGLAGTATLATAAASGGAASEPDHASFGLPAAVLGALETPALQAFGPRPQEAGVVNVAGESWTLIPAGEDGWCVDVGDITLSCGTRADIDAGRLAITSIAAPAGDAAVQLAQRRHQAAQRGEPLPAHGAQPTLAVRRGIAPDGAATAAALDGGGRSIAAVAVHAHGAYVLRLGREGRAARVEFRDAAGHRLAAVPAL